MPLSCKRCSKCAVKMAYLDPVKPIEIVVIPCIFHSKFLLTHLLFPKGNKIGGQGQPLLQKNYEKKIYMDAPKLQTLQ